MKIAITISGEKMSDPLDMRFGRAPRFLLYDLENESFELINNEQNLNAAQGAGIQAAQNVANAGAEAVITGHCGPKAFNVLRQAGVAVYTSTASSVDEALKLFKEGALPLAQEANVQGHW